MYGKLFRQMYDSTLAEDWRALVTFQQLIILCDIDGVVDMTPGAISRTTNIPLDIIEPGLQVLEQADPTSRSQDADGKRIERLDDHRGWGWKIVNYKKYRHLVDAETVREQNRERQRRYREKHSVTPSNAVVTEGNNESRYAEAEAEAEAENISSLREEVETHVSTPERNGVPFTEIVSLYHETLPELPKCVKLTKQRRGHIRQRWLEDLPALEEWKKYFELVKRSRFLMGKAPPRNGSPPFRATLDWLCKSENCVKVVEGKYG